MRLAPWLLASFSVCLCGACNKTQPPPFKPVADVKELMNDILDPAADDVWGASGWIETKDGVVQRGPQNNEEWTAVRNRAMTVAEAGNLLMIVPRAKDGGQWMTFARARRQGRRVCQGGRRQEQATHVRCGWGALSNMP